MDILSILTESDIDELAERLVPIIAQKLLVIHRVWGGESMGSRVSLGKNVVVNNALFNVESGNIVLEDEVFFGHNVSILTGKHDWTKKGLERQYSIPNQGRDIVIRKGVWIASNVTVIGPCDIGENSVITAGSVVTGNVSANSIYGGSLAKFIKKI